MNSLNQLFHILILLYLGFFTHIVYSVIMFYQKKLKLVKAAILFVFISILIIKVIHKYNIEMNILLSIIYVIGIILSFNLFEKYLIKINTKYKLILTLSLYWVKYIIKLISIPPIYYHVKCKFYTLNYYRKHKWLKPIGIKRLF